MTTTRPMLHLFCGKIAAGKSTLAARIAEESGAVLISEDHWLAALYGDQMTSLADYVRCSTRLQAAMGPHVAGLLWAGVSVVLDFPANTPGQRAWMRRVLDDSGADHRLHLLTPPDAVCLERLHARNAAGDHPFAATEAQFAQVSKHFSPPTEDEGFTVVPR
ncbi:AAA family ATPase [Marivivens marinus]|uniref:AAA family ATPase n=1 Tax=Marivivens marinus TaxID=3110173 RepID=UPI003B847DC8